MKVLVTGGAGYIGSHTAKELWRQGHTPVVLDNLLGGHSSAVRWGPFYEGNILDTSQVERVLVFEEIEAVLHFAAFASVAESVHEPLKYYRNNVLGTLSLLEAMRSQGVQKLVFSSTCATYGVPTTEAISENCPQRPVNPYGRSKLMVEDILRDYVKAHDFSVTALRYFNAAGADQDLEIGENHHPETHLIPLAIEAAHNSARAMTIFGDDYQTTDGTCIRDYVHVSDLARAHVLALEKQEQRAFSFYNLGTGKGSSVKEVIKLVGQITGKKVAVKQGQRRPGDPPILVASGEKAQRELNWKPIESGLGHIIETAHHWYQKN